MLERGFEHQTKGLILMGWSPLPKRHQKCQSGS
jgi:hypothetical protein